MVKTPHKICRLCACPALDGGVPVSKLDLDKLSKWSLSHVGEELEAVDLKDDVVCIFCVWDARSDSGGGDDLRWWPKEVEGQSDNFKCLLNNYKVVKNSKNLRLTLKRKSADDEQEDESKTSPESPKEQKMDTAWSGNPQSQLVPNCNVEGAFKCNFYLPCNAAFETQYEREKHLVEEHNTNKVVRFNCTFCNRSFYQKTTFKKHHHEKHTDAFECTYKECGTFFKKQEDLDLHFTNNHEEIERRKVMQCTFCSTRLTTRQGLKNHILLNHSNKSLQCPECPKMFARDRLLSRHMLMSHTWQKCCYCNVVLLNMSMKTHHKSRNCSACGKVFPCVALFREHNVKSLKCHLGLVVAHNIDARVQ